MVLYQRLRDLREDSDKSQGEIAKIIGTSQSYYAQYENGKRAIPFERVVILANYYNVSLDYIAGFIDEPRKLRWKRTEKSTSPSFYIDFIFPKNLLYNLFPYKAVRFLSQRLKVSLWEL